MYEDDLFPSLLGEACFLAGSGVAGLKLRRRLKRPGGSKGAARGCTLANARRNSYRPSIM